MKRMFKSSKIQYNFRNNVTFAAVEIDLLHNQRKDLEKSELLNCYYNFKPDYIKKLCKSFNLTYNESRPIMVFVRTECTDNDNYDKATGIYIASRKLELKLNKIDLYIKKDIYKFFKKMKDVYIKEVLDKDVKMAENKYTIDIAKNDTSCLITEIDKIRNSMKNDSSDSN